MDGPRNRDSAPWNLVGLFYWSEFLRKLFGMYLRTHSGLAALGFLLAVCASTEARPQALQERPLLIVTDETGRRVAVPGEVKRIVSLAPNLTEILYALGVQDRLVGDTTYCHDPPEALQKPHIGAPLSPSLEAILALEPDLVLATTSINRRETVEALERLGLAVYAADPHSVQGMILGVNRLASLVGAAARGAALVDSMEARLDLLEARLAGAKARRVLFVVWEAPLISAGPNTFIADALRLAGGESVIKSSVSTEWPHVSLEEVVRLDPEYLIFARDRDHAPSAEEEIAKLRARAGWKGLPVVRNGRIVVVSDAIDRPAPRLLDAVEELAAELHPEAFPEPATPRKENDNEPTAPPVKPAPQRGPAARGGG